jgi:hypothetical protein
MIWGLLLARFYYYPYTFKASFLHPTESLFVPASVVSFGTILINVSQYGAGSTGYWLQRAVGILFWIDATLAVMFSAGIYVLLYDFHLLTKKTILIYLLQVVNPDLHHRTNDSNLDLPCLPYAHHWTSCWRLERKTGSVTLLAHHHWGHDDPGSRVFGFADGLLGLYLSTHDAETSQGECAPWYVCLCGSQRIHRRGDGQYGRPCEAMLSS